MFGRYPGNSVGVVVDKVPDGISYALETQDRSFFPRVRSVTGNTLLHEIVPPEDIAFMRRFEDRFVIGDYLFVHAGIKPGVPLEAQTTEYLRWMREPFISYKGDHGWCVVHGHTITEDVVVTPNRIGIDTGGFASGRLTALGLEGTARWVLQTSKAEGGPVTIERREL